MLNEVEYGNSTKYLAIIEQDWELITSKHLFKILSEFDVQNVKIHINKQSNRQKDRQKIIHNHEEETKSSNIDKGCFDLTNTDKTHQIDIQSGKTDETDVYTSVTHDQYPKIGDTNNKNEKNGFQKDESDPSAGDSTILRDSSLNHETQAVELDQPQKGSSDPEFSEKDQNQSNEHVKIHEDKINAPKDRYTGYYIAVATFRSQKDAEAAYLCFDCTEILNSGMYLDFRFITTDYMLKNLGDVVCETHLKTKRDQRTLEKSHRVDNTSSEHPKNPREADMTETEICSNAINDVHGPSVPNYSANQGSVENLEKISDFCPAPSVLNVSGDQKPVLNCVDNRSAPTSAPYCLENNSENNSQKAVSTDSETHLTDVTEKNRTNQKELPFIINVDPQKKKVNVIEAFSKGIAEDIESDSDFYDLCQGKHKSKKNKRKRKQRDQNSEDIYSDSIDDILEISPEIQSQNKQVVAEKSHTDDISGTHPEMSRKTYKNIKAKNVPITKDAQQMLQNVVMEKKPYKAAVNLEDKRFKALFEDKDFEIDVTSKKFKVDPTLREIMRKRREKRESYQE